MGEHRPGFPESEVYGLTPYYRVADEPLRVTSELAGWEWIVRRGPGDYLRVYRRATTVGAEREIVSPISPLVAALDIAPTQPRWRLPDDLSQLLDAEPEPDDDLHCFIRRVIHHWRAQSPLGRCPVSFLPRNHIALLDGRPIHVTNSQREALLRLEAAWRQGLDGVRLDRKHSDVDRRHAAALGRLRSEVPQTREFIRSPRNGLRGKPRDGEPALWSFTWPASPERN